jgi:hypothetical protein
MAMAAIFGVVNLFPLLRERGRMPCQKQAKGQRSGKGTGLRIREYSGHGSLEETAANQHVAANLRKNNFGELFDEQRFEVNRFDSAPF